MPYRKNGFFAGEYYHLFNRVSPGRMLFQSRYDYRRFQDLMAKILPEHPLRLASFCLMPTHFHLLTRVLEDGFGLSRFISRLLNPYVRKLQVRDHGLGRFFTGRFKHVRIENAGHLLHVMRYIHLNPVMAGLVRFPGEWPFSDYRDTVHSDPGVSGSISSALETLNLLGLSQRDYENFVMRTPGSEGSCIRHA